MPGKASPALSLDVVVLALCCSMPHSPAVGIAAASALQAIRPHSCCCCCVRQALLHRVLAAINRHGAQLSAAAAAGWGACLSPLHAAVPAGTAAAAGLRPWVCLCSSLRCACACVSSRSSNLLLQRLLRSPVRQLLEAQTWRQQQELSQLSCFEASSMVNQYC
jgi:hypothetical protein